MEKEDSNQVEIKGPDTAVDNIKFMRSVVEKMSRQVKPDVHIMIVCGLTCMVLYATLYFFKTRQLDKWMWVLGLSLTAVLFIYALISLIRIAQAEKKAGFISAHFNLKRNA